MQYMSLHSSVLYSSMCSSVNRQMYQWVDVAATPWSCSKYVRRLSDEPMGHMAAQGARPRQPHGRYIHRFTDEFTGYMVR
jgi:hypothetical protein